jgi:hypothetical protein
MTDFPQLKLKILPTFPATLTGGPGIVVANSAGSYTVNLAFSEFLPALGVIADPTNTLALVWNQLTLQYALVQAASVFGAPTNNPTFTGTVTINGNTVTTGSLLSTGQGGVGYATGAGGTITQITSRTTAVTLNKITGAITLFAAAPVVGTWFSFVVTNSSVAANDTVSLSVKSATNTYVALISTVAVGSFQISMMSVAGTASDSPVLNFNVIKGSAT